MNSMNAHPSSKTVMTQIIKPNNNLEEKTRFVKDDEIDHQNIIVSDDNLLENNRNKRLCRFLTLIFSFCAIVGAVTMWTMNQSQANHKTSKRDIDSIDLFEDQPSTTHKQSKSKADDGCESTLVLMRHCEKLGPTQDEVGNEHCSYVGHQRSRYIATLFGDSATDRWPTPSRLFALSSDRSAHQNFREYETIQPLSQKTGIRIEYASHPDFAITYLDLLRSRALCGQVSVVSWKHSYIGELAASLGCGPDQGCPEEYNESEYDQIWIIQYIFQHPPSNTTAEPLHDGKASSAEVVTPAGDTDRGDDDGNTRRTRRLGGKKGGGGGGDGGGEKPKLKPEWDIYGSLSYQRFDPLAFAKASGSSRGDRLLSATADEM